MHSWTKYFSMDVKNDSDMRHEFRLTVKDNRILDEAEDVPMVNVDIEKDELILKLKKKLEKLEAVEATQQKLKLELSNLKLKLTKSVKL